jgi:hypothetical protein
MAVLKHVIISCMVCTASAFSVSGPCCDYNVSAYAFFWLKLSSLTMYVSESHLLMWQSLHAYLLMWQSLQALSLSFVLGCWFVTHLPYLLSAFAASIDQ